VTNYCLVRDLIASWEISSTLGSFPTEQLNMSRTLSSSSAGNFFEFPCRKDDLELVHFVFADLTKYDHLESEDDLLLWVVNSTMGFGIGLKRGGLTPFSEPGRICRRAKDELDSTVAA